MLTGLGRQAALTINTKAANCCDTYCAGYGTESGCDSQFLQRPKLRLSHMLFVHLEQRPLGH